jgi:hypothetical protein
LSFFSLAAPSNCRLFLCALSPESLSFLSLAAPSNCRLFLCGFRLGRLYGFRLRRLYGLRLKLLARRGFFHGLLPAPLAFALLLLLVGLILRPVAIFCLFAAFYALVGAGATA